MVPDPIAPPSARWPLEAAELVALAVSDGDLGAAVAQYEPAALLRPWADDRVDGGSVHETMAAIMRLRLPLDTRLVAVLPADGLAMLVCERRIDGTGPDGRQVRLHGTGCTVVRPQPDGSWRIAADAWQLAGPGGGRDSLDGPGNVGEGL
jgi:ketosteroid isomerase-like protein